MKKLISIVVVVIIIVGAGCFFAGMKYASYKSSNGAARFMNNKMQFDEKQFQGREERNGNGAGMMRGITGGTVFGEIISKDDKSVTVKLNNGGSKIIFLSDNTKITKDTDASRDEIVVGRQINVIGTASSDGSVTAQSIQLRTIPEIKK